MTTALSALSAALRDLRGVTITGDEDCARALLARLEAGGWRVVEATLTVGTFAATVAKEIERITSGPDAASWYDGISYQRDWSADERAAAYALIRAAMRKAAGAAPDADIDDHGHGREVVWRVLTVGAALADPRVQDGSHVVEYDDLGMWRQIRASKGDSLSARTFVRGFRGSPPEYAMTWPAWKSTGFDNRDAAEVWSEEYARPCRLVPVTEADRDPSERGAL